jgi:hypothetical protein
MPVSTTSTFVMPHYSDTPRHRAYLKRAIEGLQAQTDPDWRLVIVDDASPRREDREYLKALEAELAGKVVVLLQDENRGAGACRNVGVCWAWDHGSEIVLFQDSDDICHPDRLRVSRAILEGSSEIDLVYSTFIPMDEDERPLAPERLVPMVAEILEAHRTSPVEGPNAWIRIGTETGFMCPMSDVPGLGGFPHVVADLGRRRWVRLRPVDPHALSHTAAAERLFEL